MKKITLLFLFIGAVAFAQKSPYAIFMDCYTNGDNIPDDGLKSKYSGAGIPSLFNLSLLKDGKGQTEASITTWEIIVFYENGKTETIKQMPGSPSIGRMDLITAKGESRPKKIVIQNISISIMQSGKQLKTKLPQHVLYRSISGGKKCS